MSIQPILRFGTSISGVSIDTLQSFEYAPFPRIQITHVRKNSETGTNFLDQVSSVLSLYSMKLHFTQLIIGLYSYKTQNDPITFEIIQYKENKDGVGEPTLFCTQGDLVYSVSI